MSYTPTIVLRKLDPSKVVATYQSGGYTSYTLPTTRVSVVANATPSTTGHTTTLRDNNNCLIVLHASNKEAVKLLPGYKPRCFWCMLDIHGSPCPVPTSMAHQWNNGDVRYVFDVSDVCCSYECALAYARSFLRDERAEVYLHLMHRLMHPTVEKPLRPAPDFRLLDTYGGTMTVDEFKQSRTTYTPLPSILLQSIAHTYAPG